MKKQQKHLSLPILLFVAFATGALGVMAGTFIVSAHGGDTSKIHACVKTTLVNGAPNVRIVGANDTCNNNETALDWNIQGIQGIPGPTGVPGTGGSSGFICINCFERDLLYRLNRNDLINVNLDSANLSGNNIPGINFTGASFVRAIMYGLQSQSSNFTNANFSYATLSGNYDNSNFTDANMSNVFFYGTNLFGATMTNTNVSDAIWQGATCPDGTNSDDHGNTCEGHLEP